MVQCVGGPKDGRIVEIQEGIRRVQFPAFPEWLGPSEAEAEAQRWIEHGYAEDEAWRIATGPHFGSITYSLDDGSLRVLPREGTP